MPLRAPYMIKRNIEALLMARGQSQKDLAQWCRRSESWISKILKEDQRELPIKYFDRIADFFGIATYQLLQPGITPLTERRKIHERRSGRDRRISQVVASRVLGSRGIDEPVLAALESDELDLIRRFRRLSADEREHLHRAAAVAHDPRSDEAKTTIPRALSPTADQPVSRARRRGIERDAAG